MSDPHFDTLWHNVLEHWDEEPAHRAFLEYCRQGQRLLEAAMRYRSVREDPQRAVRATEQLARVATLTVAELELRRVAAGPATRRGAGWGLALLFLSAAIGLLGYLYTTR